MILTPLSCMFVIHLLSIYVVIASFITLSACTSSPLLLRHTSREQVIYFSCSFFLFIAAPLSLQIFNASRWVFFFVFLAASLSLPPNFTLTSTRKCVLAVVSSCLLPYRYLQNLYASLYVFLHFLPRCVSLLRQTSLQRVI